jgi:hypothetical protein
VRSDKQRQTTDELQRRSAPPAQQRAVGCCRCPLWMAARQSGQVAKYNSTQVSQPGGPQSDDKHRKMKNCLSCHAMNRLNVPKRHLSHLCRPRLLHELLFPKRYAVQMWPLDDWKTRPTCARWLRTVQNVSFCRLCCKHSHRGGGDELLLLNVAHDLQSPAFYSVDVKCVNISLDVNGWKRA